MRLTFPYEEKRSNIFPIIMRPTADVFIWSKLVNSLLKYKMIVDTGADFTILPRYCSVDLGVNLKKDCISKKTSGVGGPATVFVLRDRAKIKIGHFQLLIPLGFLDSDDIPPLLGREGCLNVFKLTFAHFKTEILNL